MTRTDYAFGMSATPSDPDYINTKALESVLNAFDHAVQGKTDLPNVESLNSDRQFLQELMGQERERRERVEQQQKQTQRRHLWHTLSPINVFIRFRDNIRLRRYNREWIKNNIQ